MGGFTCYIDVLQRIGENWYLPVVNCPVQTIELTGCFKNRQTLAYAPIWFDDDHKVGLKLFLDDVQKKKGKKRDDGHDGNQKKTRPKTKNAFARVEEGTTCAIIVGLTESEVKEHVPKLKTYIQECSTDAASQLEGPTAAPENPTTAPEDPT